ncbi:hypothetical protein [Epilithonimonas sp.]|uniref:hypothetical protein n=1 Tax=Epilithonimonas sp. TaxID=2894511 RepID=UPI0028A22E5A|nr:hypothetical protein [Epilithonimonas sp.]
MNFRTSENSWSILECLEHLNFYGNFYLPEIENRINENQFIATRFQNWIFRKLFASMMLPKEKLNKMKTLKISNPIHNLLDKSVIDEFIKQQNKMLELLEKAKRLIGRKLKHQLVFQNSLN